MIRSFPGLLLIISLFLFVPCVSYAKRINVHTLEELMLAANKSNNTIVVRKHIDLEKNRVILSKNSVMRFKCGSLKNGIIEGNQTYLKGTKKNVFRDCTIAGTWNTVCAYSSMFDNDLETMTLLKNMSVLSPVLRLSADRAYRIHAQGETLFAEVIEAEGKEKPTLIFHTTAPNVEGLLIKGKNVILRNLIVTDDYDEKNDALYGANKQTSGNTISVKGVKNAVETLIVDGCDFQGGTSSSWVASSQTKNCRVENCTFTGYMADHGVYCSMKVETYQVKNCKLRDITRASGVFKVRTSKNLHSYSIINVDAHNMNSYLGMLSLMETPEAEVTLNHICVTKDEDNNSVFYGFCFNDETKSLMGKGYNASRITFSYCTFGYGYKGNSIIYHGAGSRVCAKEIVYDHVVASESNFGGGVADKIAVMNSRFDECCGDKGIYFSARSLQIENSEIRSSRARKSLFWVNPDNQLMQSASLNNVTMDANVTNLFNVVTGDNIDIHLEDCIMMQKPLELIKSPTTARVNYRAERSVFNEKH